MTTTGYKGYTEVLCEQGHYGRFTVTDETELPPVDRCSLPECRGTIEWTREVDLTDGERADAPDSLSAHLLGWLLRIPTASGDVRAAIREPRYLLTPTYYDTVRQWPPRSTPNHPRCE